MILTVSKLTPFVKNRGTRLARKHRCGGSIPTKRAQARFSRVMDRKGALDERSFLLP